MSARHLADKGDQPASIEVTRWAIAHMFPDESALRSLNAKRCAALYGELRTRPSARTGRPLAAVEGIGKRRPRGKSLGKAGNELRVKQTRTWYRKALELATGGDRGATAALVALLLGMRASEIVSRRAGDLFECERPHERAAHKPHGRDWVIDQVHRICDLAEVPSVTAHAMRGLLATLTVERGFAGHLIAATLGHEDERTTMTAYAAPGSAAAGDRRRGLVVLNGGVQAAGKSAK